MQLCTKEDDFVFERLRWVVHLSDGNKVFQDDGRPGIKPASAWIRLGNYIRRNGIYITNMKLQFRSNVVGIGEDADGYFFCQSVARTNITPVTAGFYLAGTLRDGILQVAKYKVPELVLVKEEKRNPAEAGLCLIKKSNGKKQNRKE